MTQASDFEVTLCPTISQPHQVSHRTLKSVLTAFSSSDDVRAKVEDVRQSESNTELSAKKTRLPIVIFGGKFSRRKNQALERASGLMVLDFDCYTQYESIELRKQLEQDKYIYSLFNSTSGIGYRALVRIPVVSGDEEYKSYFNSIHERYPSIDIACKDIARASFYTYDPNLIIKENAEIWTYQKQVKRNSVSGITLPSNKHNDYNKANRVLNIIRHAAVGERHNKILKAAILMGGYVASGDIEYSEGERLLKQESEAADPESYKINEKAIDDGLKRGIESPLQDDNDLEREETQARFGKIYYTLNDVEDKIDRKYQEGIGQAYEVGYPSIDDIYKIFPGYFTTIFGPAFTGKSLIWYDFLKNLSFRYGAKHCVFSPETGANDDIFIKIIEMVAEQDFYDLYGNQMNSERLERAKRFVDEHFIVIDPGEYTMDIETAVEYLQIIESVYDVKVATLTLDPWNDLDHPIHKTENREDKYLEWALKRIRLAAHYNNWHICIITHARDQQLRSEKNDEGDTISFYPPASIREISGGQTWSRKGFQMASIWRPPQGLEHFRGIELSGRGDETIWIQQKFKPDYAGNNGYAIMRLDPKRHAFYEGDPENPRYADLFIDKWGDSKNPLRLDNQESEPDYKPNNDVPF